MDPQAQKYEAWRYGRINNTTHALLEIYLPTVWNHTALTAHDLLRPFMEFAGVEMSSKEFFEDYTWSFMRRIVTRLYERGYTHDDIMARAALLIHLPTP